MCEANISSVIKYSAWWLELILPGIKRNVIQRMCKEKLSQRRENFVKQEENRLYQPSTFSLLENIFKVNF